MGQPRISAGLSPCPSSPTPGSLSRLLPHVSFWPGVTPGLHSLGPSQLRRAVTTRTGTCHPSLHGWSRPLSRWELRNGPVLGSLATNSSLLQQIPAKVTQVTWQEPEHPWPAQSRGYGDGISIRSANSLGPGFANLLSDAASWPFPSGWALGDLEAPGHSEYLLVARDSTPSN